MKNPEIEEKRQQVAKLQQEITALEEVDRKLAELGPEFLLAVQLHDKFCRWNHTDGCSWFYEVDDKDTWAQSSHKEYLTKARKLILKCEAVGITPEIALAVSSLLEE